MTNINYIDLLIEKWEDEARYWATENPQPKPHIHTIFTQGFRDCKAF